MTLYIFISEQLAKMTIVDQRLRVSGERNFSYDYAQPLTV